MKRVISVIVIIAIFGVMMIGCGNRNGNRNRDDAADMIGGSGIVESEENVATKQCDINEFGLELLAGNLDGVNPVISPLSAFLALHMAAEGSEGNTKAQFEAVMGDMLSQENMSKSCREKLIKHTSGMEFNIQDSIWINDSFKVNKEWKKKIMSFKGNTAYNTDLSSPEIVDDINSWVSKSTKGHIDKMIDEPFSEDTVLVLFDALYMEGKWEKAFSKDNTCEDEFSLGDGTTKYVPMMNLYNKDFEYFANNAIEGIILPYKDSTLSFIAVRAKKGNIREIMTHMSSDDMLKLIGEKQRKTVSLKLPGFDITYCNSLNQSLIDMGIEDAFTCAADFSSMGADKSGLGIYIDKVIQKTKVKVDESGTEAAAVTEITMAKNCVEVSLDTPYEISFNEPFYYAIMDMDGYIPVFMGIMDDPGLTE